MTDRWLDIETAARYIGVGVQAFARGVKAGQLPAPSRVLGPRRSRWDRLALDDVMTGAKADNSVTVAVNGVVAKIEAEGRARRKAREARRNAG